MILYPFRVCAFALTACVHTSARTPTIGGSKSRPPPPFPKRTKHFLISCSLKENLAKWYFGAPCISNAYLKGQLQWFGIVFISAAVWNNKFTGEQNAKDTKHLRPVQVLFTFLRLSFNITSSVCDSSSSVYVL